MFKNIQNYLLLRHPLLWNLKIVPLLACLLILHLVFFVLGYTNGKIDFTETGFEYFSYDTDTPLVIFFSIFLSLLFFILWMVFYFRNNAYKSYYPLSNSSLYKEWLIILLVCILNCTYSASYFFANDLRAKNYLTEQELEKRLDVISMASVFVEGSFEGTESQVVDTNGQREVVEQKFVTFKGKDYPLQSLMNKSLKGFVYQSAQKDSVNKAKIRTWLAEGRKDSILWVMTELDKIAKEHNLKSNITPQKWFSLMYDGADFTNYATIGEIESYPLNHGYNYAMGEYPANNHGVDNKWFQIKSINGTDIVFAKYYVPTLQINNAYEKISKSWANPTIDEDAGLFYLFFSFTLSLAIFSFRVTSGRQWLIAFVALGVTGMLSGIFTLITSGGEAYFMIWLFIVMALLIWFIIICTGKKGKGISGIIVNNLLWLGLWALPMLYFTIVYAWRHSYYSTATMEPEPVKDWIKNNNVLLMYCNFAFVVVYMYFFTKAIKKWKGIAED